MADFDWMALWQNAQPDAPCADENCDTCLAAAASLREQIDVAFVAREEYDKLGMGALAHIADIGAQLGKAQARIAELEAQIAAYDSVA